MIRVGFSPAKTGQQNLENMGNVDRGNDRDNFPLVRRGPDIQIMTVPISGNGMAAR